MKTLYIAEKPELGKAIAKGIGSNFKTENGFMSDGQNIITWCFGHVLELKEPEDYDLEKYKKWSLEQLPIYLPQAEKKLKANTKKQFMVIKKLIEDADIIVNAGDIDEEGQLLVDEVIRFCGAGNKPVKRVLINDNTPVLVAKAVANLQDNSKYEYMGWIAEARSLADYHFGINLTRGYTKLAEKQGNKGLVTIGRVQSAVLGIIVRRCREFKNHKKSFYYLLNGDFKLGAIELPARYDINADKAINGVKLSLDDKKRMVDKSQVTAIADQCKGKTATITLAETTKEKEFAPLPYDLLSLQVDCGKKFGMKPKKVMEVTQSLREKHCLITYNRSDNRYLSDEQHLDAPAVLDAINKTLTSVLGSAVAGANSTLKSKAFNTANVGVHHAIIPTQTVGNINSLSIDEKNVYELIAKAYISQFYPPYEYEKTVIELEVEGNTFKASSSLPLVQGWKALGVDAEEEKAEDDNELSVDLKSLKVGDSGICTKTTITDKETKPKPLFTMPMLLKEFTKVADHVKSPELAKALRDKDKGKKGENGGIGTSSTRDSIIERLFKVGVIAEDKKKIVSTPQGEALYDALSDEIRYPDISAIWVTHFPNIKNQNDVQAFLKFVMDSQVSPEVAKLKGGVDLPKVGVARSSAPLSDKKFPCPKCGRDMLLRSTPYGNAWGCVGFFDKENQCKTMFKDDNGKPLIPKPEDEAKKQAKKPVELSEHKCGACGKPLIWRKADTGGKDGKGFSFFGCSGFPKCKQNYKEVDGKPVY
ncbi:hypothetical protein A9299_10055 [Moraxella osloensis]|uniref:DNA topoisomerase n=1 Tax=Faucicola osloensis TaxID=34062 RepID=A0AA91FQJ7_FAUOS|nr:DNA topoisomerase [Moraxella osloensis]OBX64340.1 hypothetical protein A9299_10055 [Moraxella osloensis]